MTYLVLQDNLQVRLVIGCDAGAQVLHREVLEAKRFLLLVELLQDFSHCGDVHFEVVAQLDALVHDFEQILDCVAKFVLLRFPKQARL